MSVAGVLAENWVQIGIQADSLKSELQKIVSEASAAGKSVEDAFNKAVNRGVKKTTGEVIRQKQEVQKLGDAYRRSMGMNASGGYGNTGERIGSAFSKSATLAASTAGTAVGLTFVAAAAAGSTTLDTLTGSIKMLTLAAGAKTQNAVMNISRGIQSMAHFVDKHVTSTDIMAGGLGIAGAGLGARYISRMLTGPAAGLRGGMIGGGVGLGAGLIAGGHDTAGGAIMGGAIGSAFGPLGALAGAGAGAIGGEIAKVMEQSRKMGEDLATKMARDPEKAAKGLEMAAKFEKSDPDVAATLREAVKKSEVMRKADPDAFKTAGLNMPMTMSSLAGAYDQGNINMMGSGGSLGIANQMREWKLNMEGMMAAARSRTSVDPNFVGPPQGN